MDASAFAMRELGFKRVLFLVHRVTLAKQAKKSFEKVFDKKVTMGLVGAGSYEYEKDYVFATVETLNRDAHLFQYQLDAFDCIILDEAHHSSNNIYTKIIDYFNPKLFLGMTATPDKRDDNQEGKNIYEIFHYQIAHEIRLQQAMEDNLLCPFHYFGVSEVISLDDKTLQATKLTDDEFNQLTSDERVKHVIEQSEYYGYSGDRVRGLIFCSCVKECEELSRKFNALGYRTIALSGADSEEKRQKAFERLAMDEADTTEEMQPLDYIFSRDILNEGWEFPGGKVEAGETPQQALVREIMEELDTEIKVGELIDTIEFDYPTFHLSMDCFWAEVRKGHLELKEAEAAKWLTRDQLDSVAWLPADVTLIDKIRRCMK